jgi:hypothetical protein
MKVLNLRCRLDHRFEGWFAGDEDFESQHERRLVACPLCDSNDISRLPTAPRLNVSGLREALPAPSGKAADPQVEVQKLWMQAVRHALAHTEDVGDRFPEEARRIHYGESPERGIRGKATRDEADALRDEGIEVVALAIPAGLTGVQ